MIFDCDYVTQLVGMWQGSHDPELLGLIIQQSRKLIEAIVSEHDSFYREDLIQECSQRVQYALPYYRQERANLHTFLTTVIRNTCMTYLRKQSRYSEEYDVIDVFESDEDNDEPYLVDEEASLEDTRLGILEDLTVRNRERFPSIPVSDIDDITEAIYESLTYGVTRRELFTTLARSVPVEKAVLEVIYTSSLLYMRFKYSWNVKKEACDGGEFSIVTDLKELFGGKLGTNISIIFSGMNVRFP